VHAKLAIATSPGHGTRIAIEVPVSGQNP